MIIITPMGGHGTVYISKHIKVCRRPDVLFGFLPDITQRGGKEPQHWGGRTRNTPWDENKTIEENLTNVVQGPSRVLLSGLCSSVYPFLSRNKFKDVVALVRHPLHAYVSYTSHQHPNVVAPFGGFKTFKAIEWWANRWNAITDDFLSSGHKIYHYEWLLEENPPGIIKKNLKKWDGSRRNYNALPKMCELELFERVENNFFKLGYKEWNNEF